MSQFSNLKYTDPFHIHGSTVISMPRPKKIFARFQPLIRRSHIRRALFRRRFGKGFLKKVKSSSKTNFGILNYALLPLLGFRMAEISTDPFCCSSWGGQYSPGGDTIHSDRNYSKDFICVACHKKNGPP